MNEKSGKDLEIERALAADAALEAVAVTAAWAALVAAAAWAAAIK